MRISPSLGVGIALLPKLTGFPTSVTKIALCVVIISELVAL
jgi:hypothetical protein